MKKLFLIFMIINIPTLSAMGYNNITLEKPSENTLEMALSTARTAEEIENLIKKYNTNHWALFKICAEKNSPYAVAHLLAKLLPPKPLPSSELYEFISKRERHDNNLMCGICPTTSYMFGHLPEYLPEWLNETISMGCLGCMGFADCVSCLTEPRKTLEEETLWKEYNKKLTCYKSVKLSCKEVMLDKAYRKGNMLFVQAFESYLANRKLTHIEQAFQ